MIWSSGKTAETATVVRSSSKLIAAVPPRIFRTRLISPRSLNSEKPSMTSERAVMVSSSEKLVEGSVKTLVYSSVSLTRSRIRSRVVTASAGSSPWTLICRSLVRGSGSWAGSHIMTL